jgi:HEAT repeat protein
VQTLVKLFEEDPFALADLLMGASLEAERAVAIRALGELSSPHVVPLLTALLDDDSTQIRVEAVRALEALQHAGADAAMTGIEAAAKDPNSDVRGAALAALVRFDDGRDSELEEALKGEPDPEVRTAIVGALAVRSDETALDLMTSSMTDPHPGVRRAAMLAALSTPHSLGLDTFLKVLENADQVEAQSLRTEALKAGVVAGLRRALRDGPLPLRVSSVRVLASLDASRFEESLLSAVGDPAPPVRSAALDALVLCDSESAWTAVIRAARDEDNWVATRARAAVAGAK